jgi:hypothetical protein
MPKSKAKNLKHPAAILGYPDKPGWWWAWYKSASRWYLINISHDDLDDGNVPPNYEWWTECVPPSPPNAAVNDETARNAMHARIYGRRDKKGQR